MMKRKTLCMVILCAILATVIGNGTLAVEVSGTPKIITEAYIERDEVSSVGIPVFKTQKDDKSELVCYIASGQMIRVTEVGKTWCQVYLDAYRNAQNKADYDPNSGKQVENDSSRNNRDAGYYYVRSASIRILPSENYLGEKSPEIVSTGKTTERLNYRSTPAMETNPSNLFGTLEKNATVQITKLNDSKGWHQIYYRNAFYYVAADYIYLPSDEGTSHPVTFETYALPSTAKVILNGKSIVFESYNVEGNTYFKLRDLAYALNGDEKNFQVNYDQTEKTIKLLRNKPYAPVGGELTKGDESVKRAKVSYSSVYVDGEKVDITAYIIQGNTYFKLRDIMKLMDIAVGWENITATIVIDTRAGYIT